MDVNVGCRSATVTFSVAVSPAATVAVTTAVPLSTAPVRRRSEWWWSKRRSRQPSLCRPSRRPVHNRDGELRARSGPRQRSGEDDAACRVRLGVVDDVIAVDRIEGHRRGVVDSYGVTHLGGDVAVGVGRLSGERQRIRAIRQRDRVGFRDRRSPRAARAYSGGIGLRERAIDCAELERGAGGETGRRSRQYDAARGMRFGVGDDVVALDCADRQGWQRLLDRHAISDRRRDIAVGVSRLGADDRRVDAVSRRNRDRRRNIRRPDAARSDGGGEGLRDASVDQKIQQMYSLCEQLSFFLESGSKKLIIYQFSLFAGAPRLISGAGT